MALSPMMQQYLQIHDQYPDCLLLFRLGDFYELFFEDAKTASRELELTLTGKDCGLEERAPMCGVPFHSVNTYIEKLISRGYNVSGSDLKQSDITDKLASHGAVIYFGHKAENVENVTNDAISSGNNSIISPKSPSSFVPSTSHPVEVLK